MFGFSSPIRLLRQKWSDPWTLAQELYVMATSREPQTVQAPVTIEVGPGETALRLVRESSPAATSQSVSRVKQQVSLTAAPERAQRIARAAEASREPPRFDIPAAIEAFHSSTGDAFRPKPLDGTPGPSPGRSPLPDLGRPPASPPPTTVAARPLKPAAEFEPPALEPARPLPPNPKVDLAPKPDKFVPATLSPSESVKSYRAPLFEVAGEVRFSGYKPVQFDTPPLLRNAETNLYEPFPYQFGSTTHIPNARPEDAGLLGSVTGEGRQTGQWQVTLYPDGPSTANADQLSVSVTILNLDPDEKAPVGLWIMPIMASEITRDTTYYYCPPVWVE